MIKKWLFSFMFAVLLFVPSLGHAGENNTDITASPETGRIDGWDIADYKSITVDVVPDGTPADDEPITEDHKDKTADVLPDGVSSDDNSTEEYKINTADIFLDIVSADGQPIEMDIKIEYYRYGFTKDFVLSVDEAGDRALGTVLIAYRTAGKKISSATLRSGEGELLLSEEAWTILGHFNAFPYEPVKIVGVIVNNVIFNPDPENLGRPTIFFIGEESGDAKAGI